MIDRHPYRTNEPEAFSVIGDIFERAVSPQAVMKSSEANQELWIQHWKDLETETGRTPFIPDLAKFFKDGDHARKPPIGRIGPVLSRGEEKRERDRAAERAGMQLLDQFRQQRARVPVMLAEQVPVPMRALL